VDDVPEAMKGWKPDSEPKTRIREMAGQKGVPLPQINTEAQAEWVGISIPRKVKTPTKVPQ